MQLETAIAWRAPRCVGERLLERGRARPERQPARAQRLGDRLKSWGSRRRSKSGSSGKASVAPSCSAIEEARARERSGNIAVAAVERIPEAPRVERGDDLGDAVRHRHQRLEAELGADLVEAHLVVARVLVAVHIGDLAAVDLLADLLHEVELAVVLARAAGVEDFARDLLGRAPRSTVRTARAASRTWM